MQKCCQIPNLFNVIVQHIHGPAEFGMVLEASYFKPNTSSVEDKAAAQRSRDFLIGWLVNLASCTTICHVRFFSPRTIEGLLVPKNSACNVSLPISPKKHERFGEGEAILFFWGREKRWSREPWVSLASIIIPQLMLLMLLHQNNILPIVWIHY